MKRKEEFVKVVGLLVCVFGSTFAMQMCPREDLESCLKLADPFIQDEKFVFPVNHAEIDTMCKAWNDLTFCVRHFVLNCFSRDNQHEFDSNVQESEETMREMCHDARYQSEYLQTANCIKQVSVTNQRCRERYNKLLNQVTNDPNYESLCCHFVKYRSCVLTFTANDCSPGASNFARQLLDRSMKFLLQKCQSANQAESIDECPGSSSASIDNPNPSLINNLTQGPRAPVPINQDLNMNQLGQPQFQPQIPQQQLPTMAAPTLTPRPTARWTFDQDDIANEPESWQYGNSAISLTLHHQLSALGSLLLVLLLTCFNRFN